MNYVPVLENFNGLNMTDRNRNNSLHLIISNYHNYNNPYDIIKLTYESYPQAIRQFNFQRKLPIHNLNINNDSNNDNYNIIEIMRIVELLTKDFPESLDRIIIIKL